MDRHHAEEFGLESGIVDLLYHQEDREDAIIVDRGGTQIGQTHKSNGERSTSST